MKLDLGNIQFYWRMIKDREKEKVDIPPFLPFEFKFNTELQLIQQNLPQHTIDMLDRVYGYDYNVGYLQDGHDLAEGYTNDFLDFFQRSIKDKNIDTIFEIGCGGGYLLKQIKKLGDYQLICLDPSPVANKNKDYFDVINTFYPSSEFTNKVDLIIHYDVLEHIENPVNFMNAHKNNLKDRKYVLFAVPDCASYIDIGDISMVLHEHINYFDEESLFLTVKNSGFTNIVIEQSKYGGVLYCFAENSTKINELELDNDMTKFINFRNKYNLVHESIDLLIDKSSREGKTIGFYVPLRALSYISKCANKDFRFFDDDKGIHKKYFDGFDIIIEDFEDLKNNPVDIIVVMSHSFGSIIKKRIKACCLNIDVKLINEFIR